MSLNVTNDRNVFPRLHLMILFSLLLVGQVMASGSVEVQITGGSNADNITRLQAQPIQGSARPVQTTPQQAQPVPQPAQRVPQPIQTSPQPIQAAPAQNIPQPAYIYGSTGVFSLFVPIGWSSTGNFAYLDIRQDLSRGGYLTTIVVFDGRSQQQLNSQSFWSGNVAQLSRFDPRNTPDPTISYAMNYWAGLLSSYGIVIMPGASSVYLGSQFADQSGRTFTILLNQLPNRVGRGNNQGITYQLLLQSSDGLQKPIDAILASSQDIRIAGYSRSPYDNRVLIFVVEGQTTNFGREEVVTLRGTDLTSGFIQSQPQPVRRR